MTRPAPLATPDARHVAKVVLEGGSAVLAFSMTPLQIAECLARALVASETRATIIEQCRAACLAVGSDAAEAAKAKDAGASEDDYIAGYQDASVDCDEALRELLDAAPQVPQGRDFPGSPDGTAVTSGPAVAAPLPLSAVAGKTDVDGEALREAMKEFPSDMQSVGLLVSLKASIRCYLNQMCLDPVACETHNGCARSLQSSEAVTDVEWQHLVEMARREGFEAGRLAGSATESPAIPIALLKDHWIAQMQCDHKNRRDRAICSCSAIALGWHDSVGQAVQSWLDHLAVVATDRTTAPK